MSELTYTTEPGADSDDDRAIDDELDAFNAAVADVGAIEHYRCVARESGVLVGGARARTWGACAELTQMWVSESRRGAGVGRKLVEMVETEARSRGCTLLYLDTFTFQAPEFYQRLGFEVACELPGFPGGVSKFIFRKTLG